METKKIALWLDHSKAHFIDTSGGKGFSQTVYSDVDKHPRENGEGSDTTSWAGHSSSNEFGKDQKEQSQLKHYYSGLIRMLENYEEILLFGSGTAKNELNNLLKENKQFSSKKILVENTPNNMTENQLFDLAKQLLNGVAVK